jgi:hypothetical protein
MRANSCARCLAAALLAMVVCPGVGRAITASTYFVQLDLGEAQEILLSGGAGYTILQSDLGYAYSASLIGGRLIMRNKLPSTPNPGDEHLLWGVYYNLGGDPFMGFWSDESTYAEYPGGVDAEFKIPGIHKCFLLPSPPSNHPFTFYNMHYHAMYFDYYSNPPGWNCREPSGKPLVYAYRPDGYVTVSDSQGNFVMIGIGAKGLYDDAYLGGARCNYGVKEPFAVAKPINVTTGNMYYRPLSDGTVKGRGMDWPCPGLTDT